MQYHLPKIRALHRAIEKTLFTIQPVFTYNRLTQAIDLLARLVNDCPANPETGDNSQLWAIGEFGHCSLDSLIVAAYWHYSHWHEGQWSDEYRALSALSDVFKPGMTSGPERDDNEYDCYVALNNMAKRATGKPVYSFAEITL
jgi:hypothetical protein